MNDRKAARIEYFDRETGTPIEECDVFTRADLVSCDNGKTLSDELNDVDERLMNLENPYKAPEVVHDGYKKYMMIDGGDYTVSFLVIKGTLPVNDVIIDNNGIQTHLSEENLSILNNTGSIDIDCDIHPTDSGSYKVTIYAMDESISSNDTVTVIFDYPSYAFMLSPTINDIGDDIITENDPFIIESDSDGNREYTMNVSQCNNKRIVFASPYEISKIKDLNGFDVTSCFNKDTMVIRCSDESDHVYHVYYSNILNLYDFKFKFII